MFNQTKEKVALITISIPDPNIPVKVKYIVLLYTVLVIIVAIINTNANKNNSFIKINTQNILTHEMVQTEVKQQYQLGLTNEEENKNI